MGMLIDGRWHDDDRALFDEDGRFRRAASLVRHRVSAGERPFPAEPGRYHLYAGEGCPWAHRVRLVRTWLGLEHAVSLSLVTRDPSPTHGWRFDETGPYRDPLGGRRYLHEVYADTADDYTGRATVPVLVDTVTGRMVNNESADIVRMLNGAFAPFADRAHDLYPRGLRDEIGELNARIYATVNNGVYRAGFARSQQAHDEAVRELFATLDELEHRLASRRYLLGGAITEADWRLFPTLVRFDAAYVPVFGCDHRTLADYPRLSAYARDLCGEPGVAETLLPDEAYRRAYVDIPFAWINRTG